MTDIYKKEKDLIGRIEAQVAGFNALAKEAGELGVLVLVKCSEVKSGGTIPISKIEIHCLQAY